MGGLAAAMSCGSSVDPIMARSSASTIPTFSIMLNPSTVRMSPGGSAVTFGTIRGVLGPVSTGIIDVPAGITTRVTTTVGPDSIMTKQYFLVADAGTALGNYSLAVRASAPGYADAEATLVLLVAKTP